MVDSETSPAGPPRRSSIASLIDETAPHSPSRSSGQATMSRLRTSSSSSLPAFSHSHSHSGATPAMSALRASQPFDQAHSQRSRITVPSSTMRMRMRGGGEVNEGETDGVRDGDVEMDSEDTRHPSQRLVESPVPGPAHSRSSSGGLVGSGTTSNRMWVESDERSTARVRETSPLTTSYSSQGIKRKSPEDEDDVHHKEVEELNRRINGVQRDRDDTDITPDEHLFARTRRSIRDHPFSQSRLSDGEGLDHHRRLSRDGLHTNMLDSTHRRSSHANSIEESARMEPPFPPDRPSSYPLHPPEFTAYPQAFSKSEPGPGQRSSPASPTGRRGSQPHVMPTSAYSHTNTPPASSTPETLVVSSRLADGSPGPAKSAVIDPQGRRLSAVSSPVSQQFPPSSAYPPSSTGNPSSARSTMQNHIPDDRADALRRYSIASNASYYSSASHSEVASTVPSHLPPVGGGASLNSIVLAAEAAAADERKIHVRRPSVPSALGHDASLHSRDNWPESPISYSVGSDSPSGTGTTPFSRSPAGFSSHRASFSGASASVPAPESLTGRRRTLSTLPKSTREAINSAEGSAGYSRSPELRESHKMAERKRRKDMKLMFDELLEVLPPEKHPKTSKWEILARCVDYIRDAEYQIANSRAETMLLRKEVQHLHRFIRDQGLRPPEGPLDTKQDSSPVHSRTAAHGQSQPPTPSNGRYQTPDDSSDASDHQSRAHLTLPPIISPKTDAF